MTSNSVQNSFPPIRACIFDMDGLLINSEDLYSVAINTILSEYGRPAFPWSIKARMQGRPFPEAAKILAEWAQIPISMEQFREKQSVLQRELFKTCSPLPGIVQLLNTLAKSTTATSSGQPRKIELALATSSHAEMYNIKPQNMGELFHLIPAEHKILGDDPRIASGRGKPLPDIYLLALESINKTLKERDEPPVKPEECLVFEDAVPGVEAGRRAGIRVIWCPYAGLLEEYRGREKEVLAGLTNEHRGLARPNDGMVGEIDDGFADLIVPTLEQFPYNRYGIITRDVAQTHQDLV